jgi:hypothetical protein
MALPLWDEGVWLQPGPEESHVHPDFGHLSSPNPASHSLPETPCSGSGAVVKQDSPIQKRSSG